MDELINKRSVVYTSSTTDHREIYDATINLLVNKEQVYCITGEVKMQQEETGAEKDFF